MCCSLAWKPGVDANGGIGCRERPSVCGSGHGVPSRDCERQRQYEAEQANDSGDEPDREYRPRAVLARAGSVS